eukprot:1298972-Amorphochlora_amoeboformis.AAC.1
MAFYIKKLANIRPYMFTLCHESVDMDEWVTEKVFHALSVGSIPIYRGSKSIKVPWARTEFSFFFCASD